LANAVKCRLFDDLSLESVETNSISEDVAASTYRKFFGNSFPAKARPDFEILGRLANRRGVSLTAFLVGSNTLKPGDDDRIDEGCTLGEVERRRVQNRPIPQNEGHGF
jgi:hypothetical protein